MKHLVDKWFKCWTSGLFRDIPVSEDFVHISPYGTISGKAQYLHIVEANTDRFLGHRFEIHDCLYEDKKACVNYSAIKADFAMPVSEWYYLSTDGLIGKIVAFYNAGGEISADKQLKTPGK